MLNNSHAKFIPHCRFLVGLGLTFCLFAPAQAQDEKWYGDVGFQFSDLNGIGEFLDASYDAKLGTIGGHIGYKIAPMIAIEGEIGIGGQDDKDIATYDPLIDFIAPPPVFDIKQAYNLGLFARLQHDFGEDVTVFARGGMANSKFDLTQTSSTDIAGQGPFVSESDINEIGPAYGIGAEVYVKKNTGLRIDLTRYEFGDLHNNSVYVGVSQKF